MAGPSRDGKNAAWSVYSRFRWLDTAPVRLFQERGPTRLPFLGIGLLICRRFAVLDQEIDQLLVLEPAAPHVVALTLDHVHRHLATQRTITAGHLGGVLVERHHRVDVAMNVQDWH